MTTFNSSKAHYVTEAVVQELQEQFGQEAVVKGGMRVQPTIDIKLQDLAKKTVKQAHGSRFGSGALADQMALVAIDPRTHYVKAIVVNRSLNEMDVRCGVTFNLYQNH